MGAGEGQTLPRRPQGPPVRLPGTRADIPGVEEPRNVEAWADALLEQHRTAPPGSAEATEASAGAAAMRNDPLVKLATTLSGEPPDPLMLERLQRSRERHVAFQKMETVVTIVGILLLCAFGFVTLDML